MTALVTDWAPAGEDEDGDAGVGRGGGVIVTCLKCDMSEGKRHTKLPPEPMPREEAAAATTAATSVMNADGIFSLEIVIFDKALYYR